MGRVYVFDKNQQKVVLIEERTDKPLTRGCPGNTIQIIPDIAPYRFVADGEMITSRSRHREKLKEGGFEEVGDQAPEWLRDFKEERDNERRRGH